MCSVHESSDGCKDGVHVLGFAHVRGFLCSHASLWGAEIGVSVCDPFFIFVPPPGSFFRSDV